MQPPPFPISIDELTSEFLSEALGQRVVDVAAQRIGADRGMLGEVFLLSLELPAGERRQLVAKFAALRAGTLASALRGRTHERELRCYEQLLSDTPVRTPASLGSWYDDETAHYLLLQEAIATDSSIDQLRGLTAHQARLVVDQMALLHSRWWASSALPTIDWLPALDAPMRIQNLTTLARSGWQPLVAMIGDELPELPPEFGQALPDRIEAALRTLAALPITLLHCDLRADNLLFDPVGDAVTLIDWQGCGVGPAAFDLAYFISQSLTIDMRRAHENDLIDRWHRQLGSQGVDTDRATLMAGYAPSFWYGMAVACALPIVADPNEPRVISLAREMTTRALAALADHNQIEVLA